MKIKDLKVGKLYEVQFGYEIGVEMLTDIVVEHGPWHGPFPAASKLYRFFFLHGKNTRILEYRTFMAEECDLFNVQKEHL